MGFFRQEYLSGLPFHPPGRPPHPDMELASPVSPALADSLPLRLFTWEAPVTGYQPAVLSRPISSNPPGGGASGKESARN